MVVSRNVLACDEDDAAGLDQSHDGRKALQRVVSDLRGVEQLVSDMRSRRHQQCVSVGRGAATDSLPMMPPAPERFSMTTVAPRISCITAAKRTRDGVDRATGSERHDDLDRAVRKRGFGVPSAHGKSNESGDEC